MEIQTGFCPGRLIDGGQVGRKDSKYICAYFRPSFKHFNIRLAKKQQHSLWIVDCRSLVGNKLMKNKTFYLFCDIPKHLLPVVQQRQRSVYQLHVFLFLSIGENVDVG